MPWIPYIYDNDVFAGIALLWAVGLAAWMVRARRRRLAAKSYVKGTILSIAGAIACLIYYSGYIISRQDFEKGQAALYQANLSQLSLALLQYAQGHKDHLPPANAWATDIQPYIHGNGPKIFKCPSAGSPFSYAFNKALGGMSFDAIPANTVMLFECDAKTINANGSAGDLAPFRDAAESYVAFVDGQVQGINSNTVGSLRWQP